MQHVLFGTATKIYCNNKRRLMVERRTAKQARTHDTTLCNIQEHYSNGMLT